MRYGSPSSIRLFSRLRISFWGRFKISRRDSSKSSPSSHCATAAGVHSRRPDLSRGLRAEPSGQLRSASFHCRRGRVGGSELNPGSLGASSVVRRMRKRRRAGAGREPAWSSRLGSGISKSPAQRAHARGVLERKQDRAKARAPYSRRRRTGPIRSRIFPRLREWRFRLFLFQP